MHADGSKRIINARSMTHICSLFLVQALKQEENKNLFKVYRVKSPAPKECGNVTKSEIPRSQQTRLHNGFPGSSRTIS